MSLRSLVQMLEPSLSLQSALGARVWVPLRLVGALPAFLLLRCQSPTYPPPQHEALGSPAPHSLSNLCVQLWDGTIAVTEDTALQRGGTKCSQLPPPWPSWALALGSVALVGGRGVGLTCLPHHPPSV